MKPRTMLAIGIGLLAALILCAGTLSAGYIAVRAFSKMAYFEDPVAINPTEAEPTEVEVIEATPETSLTPTPPEAATETAIEVDLEWLFEPFWESWQSLHDNYVDQPVDDEAMMQGALEGMTALLEENGIFVDEVVLPEDAPDPSSLADEARTPPSVHEISLPFWEAWQKALANDLGEALTPELLMESALRGMVDSLGDPHTAFMTQYEYEQINIPLQGEYEGIGAWVDTTGEYVTIITPMQGSPAEAAGLKPGDQIIAVDGKDMTGVPGDLVIRDVLGPAGTDVTLTIRREGVDEPFDVTITRAHITIPSVEGEMLENGIAYVQLFTFSDKAPDELHVLLEELLAQNPKGLILDLRNNGGGFLFSAIDITSEFIEEGQVLMYEEYGDGSQDVYEASGGGVATEIPLVVLVNGGTASASEILAGAVQDYERGYLVGTTTFGKGSVQLPVVLSDNRGALRITIARWVTPDGRQIHDVGLEPDFWVELTEEDVAAEEDPQLDKAIELLLGSANVIQPATFFGIETKVWSNRIDI